MVCAVGDDEIREIGRPQTGQAVLVQGYGDGLWMRLDSAVKTGVGAALQRTECSVCILQWSGMGGHLHLSRGVR